MPPHPPAAIRASSAWNFLGASGNPRISKTKSTTALTYLRIPGTFEYWDILDKNLSATMSGEMSAQEALDATAAAWEGVTDRLGRDSQLQYYQDAIGYDGMM